MLRRFTRSCLLRHGTHASVSRGLSGRFASCVQLRQSSSFLSDEEFRKAMTDVTEFIIEYRREMRKVPSEIPVAKLGRASLSGLQLPDATLELEPQSETGNGRHNEVLSDIRSHIVPNMNHWDSSNFYAWFNGANDYASVIASTLGSGLGTVPFTYRSNPASTELEMRTMDWFADFLNLPEVFKHSAKLGGGGMIQNSAGAGVLAAMFAAKRRVLDTHSTTKASDLVCYMSDQTHMCVPKAAHILGIENVRFLETTPETGYALTDSSALTAAMHKDISNGLTPFFVCLTIGTTAVGAIDNVASILTQVKKQPFADDIWSHVDGAYGLSYGCLPEMGHLLEGMQLADSCAVNGTKALLLTFPCSLFYTANANALETALCMDPEYLKDASGRHGVDFKNWQLELGRPFGSLKLLCAAKLIGPQMYRKHLRTRLQLAEFTEQQLADAFGDNIELCVQPSKRLLGFICFRLKALSCAQHIELLNRVNETGKVYLIHTKLSNRIVLRIAVGGSESRGSRSVEHLVHTLATEYGAYKKIAADSSK